MIEKYRNFTPQIAATAYVHESAVVIGKVKLADNASVWPQAVLRGDLSAIELGENSNVQDGCVIHVDHDTPCVIGPDVTIGHGAVLHSCTVGAHSLIGMKAVVMSAVIGEDCLVGAGSVVTPGKNIPPRSLVMGVPAKIIRQLDDAEVAHLRTANQAYLTLLQDYKNNCPEVF